MLNFLPENSDLLPWVMLLIASLGIFVWRILGLVLSKKIDKDSLLAKWINAVAFAMTTGLMIRIIIFPTGAIICSRRMDKQPHNNACHDVYWLFIWEFCIGDKSSL